MFLSIIADCVVLSYLLGCSIHLSVRMGATLSFFYCETAKCYKLFTVNSYLDNIEVVGKCFYCDYKAPESYHCASVKVFAPIF